jgi:hypothetical protein
LPVLRQAVFVIEKSGKPQKMCTFTVVPGKGKYVQKLTLVTWNIEQT